MEESNKVRVKNEPIWDSHSIPENSETKRQSYKLKKEPLDNEIQTSKSHIVVKTEEKFWSSSEEFSKVVSIGFLNEETSLKNIQATTSRNNKNSYWRKAF